MNPVLIEFTRGQLVESWHRGAIAVADANGRLVGALGDAERTVFPRSAVKAFQAMPLIETGAADALGFGDAEIALAAASHAGTPDHVALAKQMIERAGLGVEALECGAHQPLAAAAARDLIRAHAQPSALHNNCSGKHAGMLATAVHLHESTSGYASAHHPVQVRVRHVIEELAGIELGSDVMGIDGCSVPTWALPLSRLARAFAAFVTGEGLSETSRKAAARIMTACWARPELVAGPGRLDTEILRALPCEVFIKTGAEGVYCAGFPKLGIGLALKIDDGAKRAAELVVRLAVARLVPAAQFSATKPELNWRGIETGRLQSSEELHRWLDALPCSSP